MSAFTLFTAGLALLAPFASAYHAPSGDAPVGNPIALPGTGSVVPAGQDYTVQWTPTTDGTVSLVLLKGPADNLVVVGTIADSIANSGSYVWKPSSDLTPGPTESTGYGIQLIVDATGQYQYTTQFGISNSWGGSSSWAASWPSSATWGSEVPTAYQSSTWATSTAWAMSSWTSDALSTTTASDSTWSDVASSTWAETTSVETTSVPTAIVTASSTLKTTVASASDTSATHTPSGPTSSTSAAAATSTGGAATLKSSFMGLVAVAGVAYLAI